MSVIGVIGVLALIEVVICMALYNKHHHRHAYADKADTGLSPSCICDGQIMRKHTEAKARLLRKWARCNQLDETVRMVWVALAKARGLFEAMGKQLCAAHQLHIDGHTRNMC